VEKMNANDNLPVDVQKDINQDLIDGQQDDLIITNNNESTAIHGQEYSSYDDLNWSSGGDSASGSAYFEG